MKLSIVVPVYGAWDAQRVVHSLLQLDPFEILVCDSSPVPTPLPEHPLVRLIHIQQRAYPGGARNAGWKQAQGDYVLFVDADVVLTEDGIHFVARHLASAPQDMAFGLYTSDCEDYNSISKFIVTVQRHRFEKEFSRNYFRYGQSSHVLVRRDLYKQIGFFNPHLRMHEDKEICIRAINAGVEINVYPDFLADHIKIFSFWSLMKDHCHKAFLAEDVLQNSPEIFNKVENQLSLRYKLSLVLSCALPVLLLLLTFADYLSWGKMLLAQALVFLSPLALTHEIFSVSEFREKVTGLLLWPCLGAVVCAGVVLAKCKAYGCWLKNRVLDAKALLRLSIRAVFRRGMPLSIVHFMTSRCNLRCEHCFYKETLDLKDPGEQSLLQLDKTTREIGGVLWYALGGGEPFLRDDLHKIHELIMKNCQPLMVSIPTNGWYTGKTYLRTLEMLQQMRRGTLTVQISVDGPEAMHDAIRGQHSWGRLLKTWQKLKELQRIYPQLSLGLITVVNNSNSHVYPDFIDDLVHTFQPNQISVNLVRSLEPGARGVSIDVLDAYKKAIERYEWHMSNRSLLDLGYFGGKVVRAKEALQKELIYRVMRFDEFVTPCTAGGLSYVIWEDGRVNACEVLPDSIGNVLGDAAENNFRNIIANDKAKVLRKKIVEEKCRCSYECAMTTNTLFSWPLAGRLWRNVLTGKKVKPLPDHKSAAGSAA